MRVLLAVDGSMATVAADFVAERRWPEGTAVDVVGVLDAGSLVPPPFTTFPADVQSLEDALQEQLSKVVGSTADALTARGLQASTWMPMGRPVDQLLRHATEHQVDVIVTGNRGHGELKSLVLGSVSAGLASHAPCPVLVVRDVRLGRVLLADDGSSSAIAAEKVVESWAMFDGIPVDVLSVAYVPAIRSAFGMLPVGVALPRYDEILREAHLKAEAINDAAVARLTASGRRTNRIVREGDPAEVVVSQAEAVGADLIVVGTHERKGLDRIVLGSVAHAVLLHAHTSVLVVRPTPSPVRGSPVRVAASPEALSVAT